MEDLADRLAAYAAGRMPDASQVRVEGVERIFGGASRQTYRFVLVWREAGEERQRPLILRRDPPGSLIETERALEFSAYRAFHGTSVPVPEPLWLEEDEGPLGHPFFVMEELRGFEASPQAILLPPVVDHLAEMGRRKWAILGEIAKADPKALGLTRVMEPVELDAAWTRELDHWEAVIDADELAPQPIIRAAIRWMRSHPPAPAQRLSVVHGDYRTGNFLYDGEGRIHGILDWEMAHLGDPLEDLAWGLNRIWHWARDERSGGLLPRAEAIACWEEASGLRADPEALRWWELFSCVKGQGIWISAAKEFEEGVNQEPIMAVSAWAMTNSQDRAALELLGRLP